MDGIFRVVRYLVACGAVLTSVVLVTSSFADDGLRISQKATRLMAESDDINRLIAEAEERARKVESSIRQAETAMQLAREEKDQEALAIATEARNLGQQTLGRAQARTRALQKQQGEVSALLGRAGSTEGAFHALDVKGEVFVKTKLGYVKVGPGFELRRGEEVRTGKHGELMLQVDSNGSKIRLHPNTVFIRSERDESTFELSVGTLKAWAVRVSQRRFSVRTSTSAVAVRGTEFEVRATAQATETRVYSGQVEVTPLAGGESILVGEGQKLIVEKSGKVSGPHPLNISRRTDGIVFTAWESL